MGNGEGVTAGAGNPAFDDKYSVSYMWEDILTKDTDDAYWACANNINQMRRDAGLPELQVDAGLSAIATQRCLDMVTTGTFSHDGCKTSGEIIARSQYTAAQACEAWRTSPSHYEAITYPDFKRMGVGCVFLEVAGQPDVYGTLWTVVFEY